MANRFLKSRRLSFEQELVDIYGTMVVGATGAVGAVKGGGVSSIARTGTGAYTITLADAYRKLVAFNCVFGDVSSIIVSVRLTETLANQTVNIKAKTVKIVCYSATATAADPAQGTVLQFHIVARSSSIGPWD